MNWLPTWLSLARSKSSRPNTFAPRLECLEDRWVPATILVTSLADAGANTLREAIATANATSANDDIIFSPSLVNQKITLATALPNISNPLTITGPGSSDNSIVIDGNNSVRPFRINSGVSASFSKLTVQRGNAGSGSTADGGGILNQGTLTLTDVLVTQNTAGDDGGGIFNSGTLTVVDSTISNNTATTLTTSHGGGIENNGTLTVRFSTITGNRANESGGFGGGIDNNGSSAVATIVGSTISGNRARLGGGIESLAASTDIVIERSTISGNFATDAGGGLRIVSTGGTITNTTIANNSTLGHFNGGGVSINASGRTLTIVNSTIVGNTDLSDESSSAGGISKDLGTLVLRNSIVSQNIAGASATDANVAAGDINTSESNLIGGDPRLTPLQDNGGPTQTMAPTAASPNTVIDAGSATAATNAGLTTDQRGFARVVNGDGNATTLVDVGAVEFSPGASQIIAVGSDAGTPATVKVFDHSGKLTRTLTPYGGFNGGVRVATGDVNRDGITDIITAAGPGGGPHILVFSGADFSILHTFFAYSTAFTGGVYVASGDINKDGFDDIITGPGAPGGPHVRVFSGANSSTVLADIFPYVTGFTGGVRVASGDLDGDGNDDVITAPGPGGGPHVRAFSGANTNTELANFFAYDPAFTGGIYVSAGDVNGDGKADIITGPGQGGGPHVRVFDGTNTNNVLHEIFPYDLGFTGGVRVSAVDRDGDGRAEVVTGAGPSGGPHVRSFDGRDLSDVDNFFAFDLDFTGGVFVG